MRKPVLAFGAAALLTLGLALVYKAELGALFARQSPIASIGSEVISETEFQSYLKDAYTSEQATEIHRKPSERQLALTRYLDHRALLAKAQSLGIDQDPRYKKALELMAVKVLARLMTDRNRESILRNSQVSPEEVKTYFEQHRQEFTEEPRFTARHLLVYVKGNPAFPEQGLNDGAARAKANRALTKLQAQESWDVVAKAYSDEVPTNENGGLLRDRQFGYAAKEVEQAIRTQELGKPVDVIKSQFGYHIVQVEQRVLENEPRPFEAVKDIITEKLTEQRSAEARTLFMTPFWNELGFTVTDAGKRDVSLLDEQAVAENEVLATVGGRSVLESDFRWFTKDAILPSQRMRAFSRPGARLSMLSSYLDMLVLEAKARKDGLDRSPEFVRTRISEEESLLAEFVRGQDKASPAVQGDQSEQERELAQRQYLERVRAEVGLKLR